MTYLDYFGMGYRLYKYKKKLIFNGITGGEYCRGWVLYFSRKRNLNGLRLFGESNIRDVIIIS